MDAFDNLGKFYRDRDNIRRAVIEGRDQGKSDQEIYDDILADFSNTGLIVHVIKTTPTRSDIEKYKVYNNILIGLNAFWIPAFAVLVIIRSFQSGDFGLLWVYLSFLFFWAVLWYFFIISPLVNYNFRIYNQWFIVVLVAIIDFIRHPAFTTSSFVIAIYLALITIPTIFLRIKLFPKSPLRQKMMKNADDIFKFSNLPLPAGRLPNYHLNIPDTRRCHQ
jgi:hypothetical protein